MSKRIGIYGGSFDPVHVGHLWIAEAARESLSLDEVRWIPAATSPLKPSGPVASNEDRLQMLRLAISGNSNFAIDDREILRGDVSYTVDTIAEMKAESPSDQYFLIIGSDSLASFDRWHQPARLLTMVEVAVVQRGGDPPIDFAVLDPFSDGNSAGHHVIAMPVIEVSSSDLRQRRANGKSIRYRVPRPVEAFIAAEKLYGSTAAGS
ncbi:Nicotinate-nucleotide adenylyltransferase [Rubripirellula tenax]|uniref:Probable nicotinate-nucleotide adenylyltransferase n=1 Tax=Rubripirellula tenax TaxID=2528015 RepID=A0A5C6FF14_9BACT|nr:nicotinate (nicotinamide) nucleotide adenylyltransferase [Rubripirellula tenax]TWU59317.1 Nicotinate-nucleotide adenylyltransferase [Rubripirellula tenax]